MKHSSLLVLFISYEEKFSENGPWSLP